MNRKDSVISWNRVLIGIMLFSIIYQSGTVQASNNPDDFFFNISRFLMLVIPLFLGIMAGNKISMKFMTNFLCMVFTMEGLALVNFILYPDSAGTLQFKILMFALFCYVFYVTDKNSTDIEEILYKILFVIAFVTIFFLCVGRYFAYAITVFYIF